MRKTWLAVGIFFAVFGYAYVWVNEEPYKQLISVSTLAFGVYSISYGLELFEEKQ